jgi:hypothetical protein
MAKLRFDPITYQFYYGSRAEGGSRARQAGFAWDPVRGRYFTGDPQIAVALASRGDRYARELLTDALTRTVASPDRACTLLH